MSISTWILNEQAYFEAPGRSLLLFHDFYPEGKQGGIELIHHGERVITNGDVRLVSTSGQWDALPQVGQRQVDRVNHHVQVPLSYPELSYILRVWAEGEKVHIVVDLEQPLNETIAARAGFNLELLPSAFWGKSLHLGEAHSIFPRQANGPVMRGADGTFNPEPLARGKKLSAAPEDRLRWLEIERLDDGEMFLYDGRISVQNNWFILRAPLRAGATKNALDLTLWAHTIPGWQRPPAILVSQVGYHPEQEKRALIEIEPQSDIKLQASLVRIEPAYGPRPILSYELAPGTRFLRYEYRTFDFSSVKETGMYQVQVGDQISDPFKIGKDVFKHDVWQPTLETFLPVQMCHMAVRDRQQLWHGACHLDDAIQAPLNHEHFDSYVQYDDTETPYAPFEHIPNLDRGGWHDAGDYDLAAGSQATTTHVLALAREAFHVENDQTTVNWDERLVTLHQPDGIPDIVQQVRHGVENLLGGYRVVGHSFAGIIESTLEQYTHLGDAATMTDNRVYDPSLAEGEISGERSGKQDDRWAFTNRNTSLEYKVAGTLAAACRVLRGYEDALAEECLETAIRVWESEKSKTPETRRNVYIPGNPEVQEVLAVVELYLATAQERFRKRIIELAPVIEENLAEVGWAVSRVLDALQDEPFLSQLKQNMINYHDELSAALAKNPFGVPFQPHVWGSTWSIQWHAVRVFYLVKAFPNLFESEILLRSLQYVLGVHPGSSTSLVSGIGARSLTTAYGTNRAEFSYIPGGGVSGPNLIYPDFPELKEDFPFLWQQAEYVIGGAATYIFCVLAADNLLNPG